MYSAVSGCCHDKVVHRLVEPGEILQFLYIIRVRQKTNVQHEIGVDGDAVFVAEGDHVDRQLCLAGLGEQAAELFVQLREREILRIYNVVGTVAHRLHERDLLPQRGLHRFARLRERVAAARFLVAADERALRRFEKQDAERAVERAQRIERAEELFKALVRAHVRDEGDFGKASLRGDAEFRERLQKRRGHVVYAVIPQILQKVCGLRFARARKTGDDQKFHSIIYLSPRSFYSRMILTSGSSSMPETRYTSF